MVADNTRAMAEDNTRGSSNRGTEPASTSRGADVVGLCERNWWFFSGEGQTKQDGDASEAAAAAPPPLRRAKRSFAYKAKLLFTPSRRHVSVDVKGRREEEETRAKLAKNSACFEVDEDGVAMIHEVIDGYKNSIDRTQADAKEKWAVVADIENVEKRKARLQSDLVEYENKISSRQTDVLKLEETLKRTTSEALRLERKEKQLCDFVTSRLETVEASKRNKQASLAKIQDMCSAELEQSHALQSGRQGQVDRAVGASKDLVEDIARTVAGARSRLAHMKQQTLKLEVGVGEIEDALEQTHEDLLALREAKVAEDAVLECEIDLGRMSDSEIVANVQGLLETIQGQKALKDELTTHLKDLDKEMQAKAQLLREFEQEKFYWNKYFHASDKPVRPSGIERDNEAPADDDCRGGVTGVAAAEADASHVKTPDPPLKHPRRRRHKQRKPPSGSAPAEEGKQRRSRLAMIL